MRHWKHDLPKNWRPTQYKKVIVSFICALIIAAVALSAVYLWRLHSATVSSDVSVYFQSGTLSLTWDTTFEMDACRIFQYDESTGKYVSRGEFQDGLIIMDAVEADKEMKLRLQAIRHMKPFGHTITLIGFSRELTLNPTEIPNIELQVSTDPERKTATINWRKNHDCIYEVYLYGDYGSRQLYSETASNSVTFDFVNDFALPDRSTPIKASIRAVRREPDYMLYSPMSESVTIARTDLLENNLSLCLEQIEERQYRLNWQECHGDWYEVQQWSEADKQWVSKCTLDWTKDLTYTTEHLPSNTQIRLRVITYDTVEERDREAFQAEPSETTFHTGMSPLYCTIWPIIPLKIMAQPQSGEILGEVPAGQALCVLEEKDGYFEILYQDDLGYIDSRFCMINLPEYMGDLCEYDITNSLQSIFRVHGYAIPEITDNVVKGYENICLGNGDYLVPYLYPCTAKLYQAACNAAADGYKLRIYDAFRPNEATRYLYDTVEALIDEPVPEEDSEDGEGEETQDDNAVKDDAEKETVEDEANGDDAEKEDVGTEETTQLPESMVMTELPQTSPSATMEVPADGIQTDGVQADGIQTDTGLTDVGQTDGELLEEAYDTYRSIMTNGRYHLSSFLAASVSAHNRGIALDLVLVDADTNENLLMQSDMHDLSWHSAISQNNENAQLLAKYMKGVGYNDLSSEWWHFQDDETRNKIGLNAYLTAGVSVEGWKRDDTGWKYRLKDGSYYRDKTVSIDGTECLFDSEGYCRDKCGSE